jgi:hypothetical protein
MKNKLIDEYSLFFNESNKDRLVFLNMSLLKSKLTLNDMIKNNFDLETIKQLTEFPSFDELWGISIKNKYNIVNQTDYIFYYFFYFSNYVKQIFILDKCSFKLTEEEFLILYEYFISNLEQVNNILEQHDRHFKSTITNNTYCYIENLYIIFYVISYINKSWFNNSLYVDLNNNVDNFANKQILNCLSHGDIIRWNVIKDIIDHKYHFTKNKKFQGFIEFVKDNQILLMKQKIDAVDILDIFNK